MEAILTRFLKFGMDEQGWSAHTFKGYRGDLRAFFRWLAGEGVTDPVGITRSHVLRHDVVQGVRGLRPESRRRKIAAIRAFTRWCVEEGMIKGNDPAISIKLPPLDESTRIPPTAQEKDALMDGCTRLRSEYRCTMAAAVLACMFFGGLRPSEACALDMIDIDSRAGVLIVQKGKNNKRREVEMNDTLVAYLALWLVARKSDPSVTRLFVTTLRQPLTYPILRTLFVEIKIAAGLRGATHLTAHTLRHWFATELHERKVDIEVIQELLGHANLNTTRGYVHVKRSARTDAVRALDSLPTTKPPPKSVQKPIRAVQGMRKAMHRRG